MSIFVIKQEDSGVLDHSPKLWGLGEGIMRKFCEIILNFDQWFRRCCLKIFLIYSPGSHFVRQRGTICAILVEGIKAPRKKAFENVIC